MKDMESSLQNLSKSKRNLVLSNTEDACTFALDPHVKTIHQTLFGTANARGPRKPLLIKCLRKASGYSFMHIILFCCR